MIDYSIGIPVRNEEFTLEKCVDSALSQTHSPSSIYICLNGSNNKTKEVARYLSSHNNLVRIIESAPGKANAWNRIVSQCEDNLVLFTDGDSYLHEDAGKKMVQTMVNYPECCVTGGDISYMTPPNSFLLKNIFRNKWDKIYRVRNLSGTNYMIRKDILMGLSKKFLASLLPPDIINDDALIGAFARHHQKFVKTDTYAKTYPVTNLRDHIESILRVKRGYNQLEIKYPYLFRDGKTLSCEENTEDKLGQLYSTSIAYTGIHSITKVLVNLICTISSQKQNVVWKEPKSAKLK